MSTHCACGNCTAIVLSTMYCPCMLLLLLSLLYIYIENLRERDSDVAACCWLMPLLLLLPPPPPSHCILTFAFVYALSYTLIEVSHK